MHQRGDFCISRGVMHQSPRAFAKGDFNLVEWQVTTMSTTDFGGFLLCIAMVVLSLITLAVYKDLRYRIDAIGSSTYPKEVGTSDHYNEEENSHQNGNNLRESSAPQINVHH